MNCTDYRDWLQLHLDGAAPLEAPAAARHRAGCAVCHGLYGAAQRLIAGVRGLADPAPPIGLRDRIVCGIRADRRRVLRLRRVAVVGALAAGLLLATFLALPYLRPTPPGTSDAVAIGPPPPAEPSLEANLHEATAALGALVRRTTDETLGQTRLLLPAVVPDVPVPDSQTLAALNTPVKPLREVQDGVADGLEPVTNSWRRAVALFSRNIPPMGPAE